MRSRFSLVIGLCLLLTSTGARAEPDAATKERARAMGTKALALYDAGDYAKAVAQFEQAYALYRAPTLGLYSARALAKLGRLTQAAARYLDVSNMVLAKDAPEQFAEAKADAATERAALIQRIPRLRVEIAGTGEGDARVMIDGVAVPLADAMTGIQLNPGAHAVKGERGGKQASMNVPLQEGETRTITLDLDTPPPAAAPAPAPAASGPSAGAPVSPPATPADRPVTQEGSTSRTLGWVFIGVGTVGVGVGAVTGLLASSKKADLEGVCKPDLDHCPEAERRVVDEYNTLRTVSTVGFIAGGVGLAGGAILLLTSKKKPAEQRTGRITPWVGVGSVGMAGRF